MASPAVQSATTSSGSASSLALAFGSSNKAGNTLLVGAFFTTQNAVISASDTRNGPYGSPVANISSGGSLRTASIFARQNIKGGANTVTVTFPSANTCAIVIAEYSQQGPPLGFTAIASGSTNPSVPVRVNTSVGDVCFGAICGSGTAQTVGLIGRNAANSLGTSFADLLIEDGLSSGGPVAVTSTGATTIWVAAVVVLVSALPTVAASSSSVQRASALGPGGLGSAMLLGSRNLGSGLGKGSAAGLGGRLLMRSNVKTASAAPVSSVVVPSPPTIVVPRLNAVFFNTD